LTPAANHATDELKETEDMNNKKGIINAITYLK